MRRCFSIFKNVHQRAKHFSRFGQLKCSILTAAAKLPAVKTPNSLDQNEGSERKTNNLNQQLQQEQPNNNGQNGQQDFTNQDRIDHGAILPR